MRGLLLAAALISTAAADPIRDSPANHGLARFVGAPATASPLPPKDVVPHPGLAAQSSIHVDLANSDVTDLLTPLGARPLVSSQDFGLLVGTCLNFMFDARGTLRAFCGVATDRGVAFEVTDLAPETLAKRSTYRLFELTLAQAMALPIYLGYMVSDDGGRVIAVGPDNVVRWIGNEADGPLEVTRTLDLSASVPVARGQIASVVPDHEGTLWFLVLGALDAGGAVQSSAMVGVVDPRTGVVSVRALEGEVVENGLAIGPDGVFVLSDRALRGMRYEGGSLVETFSLAYPRATTRKVGTISWGSGSTPTLVGDHLLAFTDNADDQVHLLVVDRRRAPPGGRRVVCDVPLFEPGASANENSVIASNGSIVVQNWYGAPTALIGGSQRGLVPGLSRYDVRPDESGCDRVWSSDALATTATLKLSTATGLLYGGMLDRANPDVDAYYLGAVDFATGREVFRVLLGVGDASNIGLSPTYVGPDGAIYQPVRSGVYRVAETSPPSGGCRVGGADGGFALLVLLAILLPCGPHRAAIARRPSGTRRRVAG